MLYRKFGRTGWQVSEIGYGMWGMGGWTGSDDAESMAGLRRAVELGCNFFDTAWGYGAGHSEKLLGQLVREYPNQTLYTASKVPPKNFKWPGRRQYNIEDVFPYDHVIQYTEDSLRNVGQDHLDLIQLHVWDDSWTAHDGWQRAARDLKESGKIRAFGISVNRWEPDNVLVALETGLVDAVQVIYNIFDQNPEDALLPACQRLDVGVIARVPFDEGSLIGNLTAESRWAEGDWRNRYFSPENLIPTLERVERLRPLVPASMSMAEMALRWILVHPAVGTIIPGMRKLANVEQNCRTSDGAPFPPELYAKLREHRWVRHPAPWSD